MFNFEANLVVQIALSLWWRQQATYYEIFNFTSSKPFSTQLQQQ